MIYSFLITIALLLTLALGLSLIKDSIQHLRFNPQDGGGVIGLVCGILILAFVFYVSQEAFIVASALPFGAWEADLKVKALIKEGKLYDYTLRQATIDAQEMANEYWARAYVVADADGDFDVMMSIPEDMTLIREVKPRE